MNLDKVPRISKQQGGSENLRRTDGNWIIKKKDVILTNPLSPRRHIDIFFTLPLPDLDSIKINKIEYRLGSADLEIEAARSFPKMFYRSLSILDHKYRSFLSLSVFFDTHEQKETLKKLCVFRITGRQEFLVLQLGIQWKRYWRLFNFLERQRFHTHLITMGKTA